MSKSWFVRFLTFLTILVCSISFAASETNSPFPLINWASKSNSEVVTIQNGSGVPLMVMITVTGGSNTAGIVVRNCNTVTHIDPGSSSICYLADPTKPVSFNSDNSNVAASGTYQLSPISRF